MDSNFQVKNDLKILDPNVQFFYKIDVCIQETFNTLQQNQKAEIKQLQDTIDNLQSNQTSQKTKIQQLQDTIDNLQSNQTKAKSSESKSIYRTCEEIRNAEPDSPSGDYWVDPDGAGYGDAPILVFCSMTTGISFDFTDFIARKKH
jgi:TolA-binding protein